MHRQTVVKRRGINTVVMDIFDEAVRKEKEIDEELNECLKTKIPLSPDEEELIDLIYGIPPTLEVTGVIQPPLSLEECLMRAQTRIAKLKERGFPLYADIDLSDPNSLVLYKQHITADVDANVESTPQSVVEVNAGSFWKYSHFVRKKIREMQTLPYSEHHEMNIDLNRFIDRVRNRSRVMNQYNSLPEHKKSRTLLVKLTYEFVKSVSEEYDSIINESIRTGRIRYDDLQPKMKKVYKSPKKEKKTVEVKDMNPIIEDRTLEVYQNKIDSTSGLPYLYRPTLSNIDENSRKNSRKQLADVMSSTIAEIKEMTRRPPTSLIPRTPKPGLTVPKRSIPRSISTAPVQRPQVAQQQMSKKEIYNMFWKMADPLAKQRQGVYRSTLDSIDLSSTIKNDLIPRKPEIDMSLPFKLSSKPDEPSEEKKEDQVIQTKKIEADQISLRLEEYKRSSYNLLEQKYEFKNADAARQLLTDSQFTKLGEGNSPVYDRLDKIWTEIGFSIQQKLEMCLKYSKDLEESTKLSDALNYWETALNASTAFNSTYKTLKNFLKHEVQEGQVTYATYQSVEDEYNAAVESIKRIAFILKDSFNDELIIKRKRVEDIIELRRTKLNFLKMGTVLEK